MNSFNKSNPFNRLPLLPPERELEAKEILFSNFLLKWNSQFINIPHILQYISSYRSISEKLDDVNYLSIEELNSSQLEWISLVAQFDNPIEKNFFKDYWVPIQKNGYDYFIDLSSDSLSLFEVHYFFFEPYRWYKNYIYRDLRQFLIEIDKSNFDIENHFNELIDNRKTGVNDFFRERDELGSEGKLDLDSIKKDHVFCEGQKSDFSLHDNFIVFGCVNSLIVGLLPYDCEITLTEFTAPDNRNGNVCDNVKTIKALVYFLQSVGFLSIVSYSVVFNSEKGCRADFKDNAFTIVHDDRGFLKGVIDKYEAFRNS